jgi:PAS domain S-box-containing protein
MTSDSARHADLFCSIVENAADIVIIVGPDGVPTYANPAVEHALGYQPAELVDTQAWELVHPDDRPHVVSASRLALQHAGVVTAATFRVRHRDGSWRTFEATGKALIGTGGVEAGIVSLRDVTERLRAEEGMREERAFRKAIENSVPAGIAAFDLEGLQTYANPAFCRMVGWSEQELVGANPPFLYWPPEETEAIAKCFNGLLARRPCSGVEVRFRRRDDERFSAFVLPSQLTDAGDKARGWVASVYDLTERKQIEESLYQSQKLGALGQLAGGIAHDFNNLVTTIRGYTELALKQVPEVGRLRPDLIEIRNTADRAASLTQQLLAFSRRRPTKLSVLDLNAEVVRIEKMLRRLISEDIDVGTQLEPHLGWVMGDPTNIDQVLVNLAVNARDAMPRGGRLTIVTANVDVDEARARTLGGVAPGSYVSLSVSDTGPGLAPEARAHLFEPFFTTKEPGKGTGLGLATTYAIVRQSGGTISVKSAAGLGATFTIYLPRVGEASLPVSPVPAESTSLAGTETILLVDDDEGVLQMAGSVLQSSGYTVLEARDPRDAVLMSDAYKRPIQLLLTDVVMRGMDGVVLAALVRRSRQDLKVLYMSGHTNHPTLLRDHLENTTAFLAKPFTPSVLIKKIRQALDRAD